MAIDLVVALAFLLAGAGFVFANLLLGRIVRPANPSGDKNSVYECGEVPIGHAWIQFNPRFYLVGLIFLLFDVEIAFVFPIAVGFKRAVAQGNGALVLVELLVFMLLLFLGLLYVWRKGDLDWVKEVSPSTNPRSGSELPHVQKS